MAWRRSSSVLLNILGRHQGNSYRTLSPLGYGQSLSVSSTYSIQFRSKSNVSLESLADQADSATNAVAPIQAIFSDAAPVLATQDLLCQFHDLAGLTWVPTIVLATVGVRMLVGLPLQVYQQKAIAKLQSIQPDIIKLKVLIKHEVSIAEKTYGWDKRKSVRTSKNAFKKHFRNIVEQNNCHPVRAIALATLQIPVWICLSSAIRNIAYKTPTTITENFAEHQFRYMEMLVEKAPLIDSLVLPDPFLLPGVFVLAQLINLQISRARELDVPQKTIQKVVPWVLGGVTVGLGVVATYVPAAVSLYWATSSVAALAVNSAMLLPFVSSKLGYPPRTKKLFKMPSFKPRLPKLLR